MINKIDFLSPPITLFHLERRTHTSKIGACLVLLLIIICLSYTIFLLYNLISHKSMTYIFHKRFEFEAGYYSFNSSSVFHFIQVFSPQHGGYFDKFDSRYIRAYTIYAQSNLSYSNLDLFDHWVFDLCRKGIDDKDIDPSLFQNVENFTNAVCIRYYYNSTEKKYYSNGDSNFNWPHLEHGISQRKNIYLTTIVQKCSNDSIINEIFGKCPPQKEIDDYVSRYFGIYLYFTDNQVDPTNYKNPVTKFLQVVSTGIGTSQTYVESYMHFSPLRIKTKIGSLFGETHDINSFYFDFNRKGAANNAGEKYFTITRYYHLMQNNVQIYERRYNNIFDLFSQIGGITQFAFYLFYWINYVYNQFVIDFDTNYLLFTINENDSKKGGNGNININTFSNKIKINGNDNKIFNIQNNILKIPRKDSKKIKNSKFFVNKINGNNKNDDKSSIHQNNLSLRGEQSKNERIRSIVGSHFNVNKSPIRKEKSLQTNIINDNSKQMLFSINNKKNYDLIDNYSSNNYNNKFTISDNNNLKLYFNNQNKKNMNDNINNINDKEKEINKKNENNFLSYISISKNSINNIGYNIKNLLKINKERHKRAKSFSILTYSKALFFKKKEKQGYQYLTSFRKRLLSEEHLLKSHIYMVLFGKKYHLNEDQTTNMYECYNEL